MRKPTAIAILEAKLYDLQIKVSEATLLTSLAAPEHAAAHLHMLDAFIETWIGCLDAIALDYSRFDQDRFDREYGDYVQQIVAGNLESFKKLTAYRNLRACMKRLGQEIPDAPRQGTTEDRDGADDSLIRPFVRGDGAASPFGD